MAELEIVVLSVKYAGAVLTAFYGIYATLTDFHTEQDGRKVLSRRGYLGIGMLVASAVLALSLEVATDAKERREREAAARLELARRDSARAAEAALLAQLRTQLERLNALREISDSSLARESLQLERQEALLAEQQAVAFNAARLLYPLPGIARVEGELEYRLDAAPPACTWRDLAPDLAGNECPTALDYARIVRDSTEALLDRWWTLVGTHEVQRIGSDLAIRTADGELLRWPASPGRPQILHSRRGSEGVNVEMAEASGEARPSVARVIFPVRTPWLHLAPPLRSRGSVPSLGEVGFELSLRRTTAPEERPDLVYAVRIGYPPEESARVMVIVDFARGMLRRSFRSGPPRLSHSNEQVLSLLDLPYRTLHVRTDGATALRGLRITLDNGRVIAPPDGRLTPAGPGVFSYRLSVADIEEEPGEFAELFRAAPWWAR